MANPIEVSQDMNAAPVVGDINIEQTARRFTLRRAAGLTGFALAAGLGVGIATEVAGDAPEAHADPVCISYLPDGTCNVWVDDEPTPTTTPTPTVLPSGGGSSGGNSGGGGGGTITPDIPYSERDNDHDGIKNGADNCDDVPNPNQSNMDGDIDGDVCESDGDIDGDTFLQRVDEEPFYDVDDRSVGLGDEGVQLAIDQHIDLTRDPENPDDPSLNELIAYTVNPADWPQTIENFAAYGVEVLATTTTTTSTTSTTSSTTTTLAPTTTASTGEVAEVEIDDTASPTSLVVDTIIDNTEAKEAKQNESEPVTTEAVILAGDSSDDPEDDSNALDFLTAPLRFIGLSEGTADAVGLTGLGVVTLGGIFIAVRRRRRDDSEEEQQNFGGTSPVAGQ